MGELATWPPHSLKAERGVRPSEGWLAELIALVGSDGTSTVKPMICRAGTK